MSYYVENCILYTLETFDDDLKGNILTDLKNVKGLVFGMCFNKEINLIEYDNLESLVFGFDFNQELSCLPKNLKILKFGYMFNQ